jgi:hypothetical protein
VNVLSEFLLAGNYSLFYSILSTRGWSGVYKTTFVDAAVTSLSAAVRDAMVQAVPRGYIRKAKLPFLFSSTLYYFIQQKKNIFSVVSKRKDMIISKSIRLLSKAF